MSVRFREWALLLVTTLVTIIIAEIALQWIPFFAARSGEYQPRSGKNQLNDIITVFEPNYSGRLVARDFNVSVRANSLGFRDREIDSAALAESMPVFFTGDSYFFGHGVEREDRISERLATILMAEGKNVPTVNFAFPGFGTAHYLDILKIYAQELNPRLVVIGFFVGNDFHDDQITLRNRAAREATAADRVPEIGMAERTRLYLKESRIVNLIKYSLWQFAWFRQLFNKAEIRNDRIEIYCNPDGAYAESLYATTFRFMDQIYSWSANSGIPIILVIVPDHLQVIGSEAFGNCDMLTPQYRIRQHMEKTGMAYLDLLPIFLGSEQPDTLFFREDKHWSAQGHELASRVLREYIPAQNAE
jgi:hypothetical protein